MNLRQLIEAADLADEVSRLMLADAMDEAGRQIEAELLRSGRDVVNEQGSIWLPIHGIRLDSGADEHTLGERVRLRCPYCGEPGSACPHALLVDADVYDSRAPEICEGRVLDLSGAYCEHPALRRKKNKSALEVLERARDRYPGSAADPDVAIVSIVHHDANVSLIPYMVGGHSVLYCANPRPAREGHHATHRGVARPGLTHAITAVVGVDASTPICPGADPLGSMSGQVSGRHESADTRTQA